MSLTVADLRSVAQGFDPAPERSWSLPGRCYVNPDFLGAAGLNRIARFMQDPRDDRSGDDWFEVVSDENGVFGCVGLMGCHDVCPKGLPLLEQYAYLRRRMLGAGVAS